MAMFCILTDWLAALFHPPMKDMIDYDVGVVESECEWNSMQTDLRFEPKAVWL